MNFISFTRKSLLEGGNLSGETEDGFVSSERIDLTKIEREQIVPILGELLRSISEKYQQDIGKPLWSLEALKELSNLSGSAKHFFSINTIDTNTFKPVISSVGDIDTMVDIEEGPSLKPFLNKLISSKYTFELKDPKDKDSKQPIAKVKCIFLKDTANQLLTIWNLESHIVKQYIQIDFELVDFDNGRPTEFSTFAHSSDWEDLSKGVKGAFHKLLLRAISRVHTIPVVIQQKTKQKEDILKRFSFAVSHGLRSEFEPITNDTGIQQTAKDTSGEDRLLVKKLDSKTAIYDKDLKSIFTKLFGNEPTTTELKQFSSFSGLLELIKGKFNKTEQVTIVKDFSGLIWDPKLRMLDVKDDIIDQKRKAIAVSLMLNTLELSNDSSIKNLIINSVKAYYRGTDYVKELQNLLN